jgi:hypothetical protein
LLIDDGVAFQLATDEQSPVTNVTYAIGNIGPAFSNVYNGGSTTGVTSRSVAHSGRITLPGGPVMEFVDVAVTDPADSDATLESPADSLVHFPIQSNNTPQSNVPALSFQTIVNNPLKAQSAQQWMEIVVGPAGNTARWDGHNLRVRYRTLAGYAAINSFVTSPIERTAAADQLVRGHNPVTISMVISYRLRPDATSVLNEVAAIATLAEYINTFDTSVTPIDMSSISNQLKNTYPSIAAVFPFEINYTLMAPTGQLIEYTTGDEVLIVDAKRNINSPSIDQVSLGISSQTIRYLTDPALISLVAL